MCAFPERHAKRMLFIPRVPPAKICVTRRKAYADTRVNVDLQKDIIEARHDHAPLNLQPYAFHRVYTNFMPTF